MKTKVAPYLFCAWVVVVCLAIGRADVSVPSIFGDHMVLQRGQANKVWGWADAGEKVTVRVAGQAHRATADEDGSWSVMLEPLEAGGPHEMTIRGRNRLEFEDVLVGEVWICSGQSNMGWSVQNSDYAALEIASANFPQIRLISVPQVGTQEPQRDFEGQWERCSPETVKDFSAVGFMFGKKLHHTLGVPVGLIDNAWGGSAAEAWVRRDYLEAEEQYEPLLERWDELAASYDEEAEREDYERRLKEWEEGGQEGRRPRWRNPLTGNHRPANIYNGVLHPTIGYGIKGVIWYQGESNAGRAYQYRDLFPLMIESWREEWGIGDFPFYYVQLADFMAEETKPGDSAWAELREAQTMTMDRLDNVGQAVIIDLGEGRDIHPRNKQEVGMRLASWALAQDYGYDIPHRSPEFDDMTVRGSKVSVDFDHVGEGLYAFDTEEVVGFAVAGEDREWHWAQARIVDENTVEVWSEEEEEPVAVRYGWANNPEVNLYRREGLPATPFRSDDWPGVTEGNVK